MLDNWRIVLASPPDREDVVAEIWHGNEMWAEVARERDCFSVEFYPRPSNLPWRFDLEEAVSAVQAAKNKLLGQQ